MFFITRPFTRFLFIKRKRKSLREVVLFYLKKKQTKKGEMGNPQKRKCSAYLERIEKRTNISKCQNDLYKILG